MPQDVVEYVAFEPSAHLAGAAAVGVLPSERRRGVARELVVAAFRRAGGKWLDLCADAGSEELYRSFQHREGAGFRIYPLAPGK